MEKFKKLLSKRLKDRISEDRLKLLPSGFQRVGDIIIVSLKPELKRFRGDIGEAILNCFGGVKTVCNKYGGVKDDIRKPSIEVIAGGGTETIHRENGCLYRFDVAKVMFAKGNVKERGRLPSLVKPGETVVDMFAGIGYFTIPIAKAGKASKVYAIEINPEAFKYLNENIRLNKIKNTETFNCDNRTPPEKIMHKADRIIMGYLPGTEKFLDAAFALLKKEGGIIHFHSTCRDCGLWEKPLAGLKQAAGRHGMEMKVLDRHVVKQYAPRVQHVVIDAAFTPAAQCSKGQG